MDTFAVHRSDFEQFSTLQLHGFLDAHTAPELEKHFETLISEGRYKIIVNFENLNYISSAGLGVFMGKIENVRNNNGDIKMCKMTPKIFRVFDLLGFPALYDIVDEEERAKFLFEKPSS
ncbi:MAG: anti-sigma factor antagonist [Calditrichaeota bacterium]|nr:MAG: anti-sigma factor antagonist [Calditrichota bacterium]